MQGFILWHRDPTRHFLLYLPMLARFFPAVQRRGNCEARPVGQHVRAGVARVCSGAVFPGFSFPGGRVDARIEMHAKQCRYVPNEIKCP